MEIEDFKNLSGIYTDPYPLIQGLGKSDDARKPKDDPEGVVDVLPDGSLAVSLTRIKVLDLLGEGEIEGLATGEWNFKGIIGRTGYNSAIMEPYPIPSGVNVRWLRSIYWNEVPVVDKDGKYNFQEISVQFTKGGENGTNNEFITEQLTVSRAINERLRGVGVNFAKVYRVLNKNCKGVKLNVRVNQLTKQNTSDKQYGDVERTNVDYVIDYKPIFDSPKLEQNYGNRRQETIKGKITYGYIRSTQINFKGDYTDDPHFLGWEIRVIRQTPDSVVGTIRNQTYVDSLTEIYGNVYTYPNSAIVAARFTAEFFNQLPTRAYDTFLLKVAVPNNYDPIRKVYGAENGGPAGTSVIWDGNFKTRNDGVLKKEWTDNPAWCFYDLISNPRYGLGKYIDTSFLDKWTLYEIAQYCDQMVSDGFGGVEPRFTCNVILFSREEAYKIINDMASIFRAMVYYSAGAIFTCQDAPKEETVIFTNANVLGGDFTYSSSSRKVRHTVALVRYNDRTNFYRPAIEYVEDIDAIRRFGIRELELTAFGCTSRGQAMRLGKWALLSESLEHESVSFTAGIEGSYLRPGDIFRVFDTHRKSKRYGGRTSQITFDASGADIILDSKITGFNSNAVYDFSLLTPSYFYDTSLVSGLQSSDVKDIRKIQIQNVHFSGNQVTTDNGLTKIRISNTFRGANNAFNTGNYKIIDQMIWSIEGSGNQNLIEISDDQYQYYRVLRVEEKEPHLYSISAISYAPEKFAAIESGFTLEQEGAYNPPPAPESLRLTLTPDGQTIDYSFGVPDSSGISRFNVYAKRESLSDTDVIDNTNLIQILPASTTEGSFVPSENGTYYFRVYSVNAGGLFSSNYASNNITVTNVNPLNDLIISSLMLSNEETEENEAGTRDEGTYKVTSPTFKWQVGFGLRDVPSDLSYRITVRPPSESNIPSSQILFEVTGFKADDPSNPFYTFDISDNIKNNIFRNYDVVVEAHNSQGYSSAGGNFIINGDSNYAAGSKGYDILNVDNPRPSALVLTTGDCDFETASYCTDQWITSAGEITLHISGLEDTDYFEDIKGGFIYYSPKQFTKDDAVQKANRIKFKNITNPLTVNARFKKNKGYMAVAFFDSFDVEIQKKREKHYNTGLAISNVVEIEQRTTSTGPSIGVGGSAYKAWIKIHVDPYTSEITWKGAGIDRVVLEGGEHRFYFTSPFENIDYSVFAINMNHRNSQPQETLSFKTPEITEQTVNFFETEYLQGTYFIGVLQEDSVN
jgi:hypothetical protein